MTGILSIGINSLARETKRETKAARKPKDTHLNGLTGMQIEAEKFWLDECRPSRRRMYSESGKAGCEEFTGQCQAVTFGRQIGADRVLRRCLGIHESTLNLIPALVPAGELGSSADGSDRKLRPQLRASFTAMAGMLAELLLIRCKERTTQLAAT